MSNAISIVDENTLWKVNPPQEGYASAGGTSRTGFLDSGLKEEVELLKKALKSVEEKCEKYRSLYEEARK